MSPAPPASTPSTLGKYHILRELGRGASSTVYLAEDRFHGRQVAIKRIHAHLLADAQQAQSYRHSFRNEAVLAGQLRHPHIVAVHDADGDAQPPYIVLEYVQGSTLSRFTRPGRLLPVSHVLDICFKSCSALEYAQGQGLVHRDIKPANLMLRQDGDVKLTDFGMAMSTSSPSVPSAGPVGSPFYMAPEQVREEPCTSHSDMFSLGVVAYELLTGGRPFDGESDYATMYRIGNAQPAAPSSLRADLPAGIDSVLLRALAKKPADRYPSWMDFAGALVAVQRQEPDGPAAHRGGEAWSRMRRLPFFSGFPDAVLWDVLQLGKLASHPAGATLIREGSVGHSFMVLLEGRVTVLRGGTPLSTVEPGVTLGEMAYLQPSNPKRTATALAESNVLALEIPNDALRKASGQVQGCFDKAFIELLLHRLVATSERLGRAGA